MPSANRVLERLEAALDRLEEERTSLGFNSPSHYTLLAQVRTRIREEILAMDRDNVIVTHPR